MMFTVKAWSKGRARSGILQIVGGSSCEIAIETPALLLSTRKGLPAFISPDLLPSLPSPDSHILQFSPLHFLEGLTPETMANCGGLHQMLGLHEYGFAAVPRDSIVCLPECNGTNKIGASFETPCGRLLIKSLEYMKMISSMKPNLWATLADEVPAWVSIKRNKNSVDRTVRWLDECIALSSTGGAVFGAIVGGSSVEERRRCAQEVAKRNVSGYWLGGFGLGESMDERSPLLNAVTDNLPEQKPRQICGLGLPEEVLQGIASGVDLFDSTYIYDLTIGGFALIFPFDQIERNVSDSQPSAIGGDQTKINLKATVYSHNTHHYLGFFRAIRQAIKEGKFEQFRQQFIENRRHQIFAASLGS
ncbi:queuine tRNA-ribosyltransferase accessory subunit 2-like isoform X2 [Camellia sinensis]|uniref:queuine tRNA-ribosyltransferase accessory subunit 2-like isoform X2 n=1 Tax=Camellia sinensis TaxID=4442 RepID=UPI0010361897|nr:queuine tRNA-ribosyltransferase accessory subunit 2-like isoform X2 [Camellia sinensis]